MKYQSANRLLATVSLDSLEYDPATNSASPHLSVTAGPVVEVKAIGAKISKKRIQEEVPIYEEHSVDRDLLMEGQRNLRDYFQSQGYFEAKVTFQEGQVVNGRQEIDYEIELGVRHRLMAVVINGNHFFNTHAITGAHADAAQVVRDASRPLQRRLPAPRPGCYFRSLPQQRLPRRQGDRTLRRRLRRPEGRHRGIHQRG